MYNSRTLCTWILVAYLIHMSNSGTFWHISDLHLDYLYTAGGNIKNWCHSYTEVTTDNKTSNDVGPAGNYNCDSPNELVISALEKMETIEKKPNFIIWTGDSAPHWKDPQPPNETYILNVTSAVFNKLEQLFPDIPIIAALGNHDASPPDQFPVTTVEKKSPEYYKSLLDRGSFGNHLVGEERETFLSCGFYTKLIDNLRFIVLNTNIYYSDNLTTIEPDPCGQMKWLNATLTNSINEKVFIVAHVPPGSFERGGRDGFKINFNRPKNYYHEINKMYVQIVTDGDNAKKIVSHLYGHLHTDTFRVFLDRAQSKEPRGVAFIAGSVTPVVWAKDGDNKTGVVGTNPSIRLFSYRDKDVKLLDYSEYSLDILDDILRTANVSEDNIPQTDTSGEQIKPLSGNNGETRRRRNVLLGNYGSETPKENSTLDEDVIDRIVTTTMPELESKESNMAPLEKSGSNDTVVVPRTSEENTSIEPDIPVDTPISTTIGPTNLNKINLISSWKLLYKATEAFSVDDLSPESMFSVVKTMAKGGEKNEIFKKYYLHNTAGHKWGVCKTECWRQHLCTITQLVEEELDTCLKANGTSGFYYESPIISTDNLPDDMNTPSSVNPVLNTNAIMETEEVTRSGDSRPEVIAEKIEDQDYVTTKAVSVFFGVVGVLILMMVGFFGYKKYKERRYRNQEFLLTDSVFRYDGYSQLDDD